MKKIVLLIILIYLLQSCGNRMPVIDGPDPFVVGSIERYSLTHSKYYSDNLNSGVNSFLSQSNPVLILPSRMFQIGDTIVAKSFVTKLN
jgi:hypothetical protein